VALVELGDESLQAVLVGDLVAGEDDFLAPRAEQLQQIAAVAGSRCGQQRIDRFFGRAEAFLCGTGRGQRRPENQRHHRHHGKGEAAHRTCISVKSIHYDLGVKKVVAAGCAGSGE
jgi:hypothetical protein